MAKRGYQPEQIISKLLEVDFLLSTGHTVQAASRHIGVTAQTEVVLKRWTLFLRAG